MDGAGGSPSRRWDRAGSQASRPRSLTTATSLSAGGSTDGFGSEGTDRAPIRQLQHEVTGLDARCKQLTEAMDQLRAATERRLEHLAASLGGAAVACSPGLPPSPARPPLGDGSSDRFMLQIATSPKSLRSSVDDRLNHIERVLGESSMDKRGASPMNGSSPKSYSDHDWQPAAVRQRVAYLETLIGDSADKHSQNMADAMSTRSKLLGVRSPKSANAQHTSLRERIDYVEEVVGDSAQKHVRELAAAHAKLDLFAVRVASCEATRDHVSELKEAHANLAQEHAEKHASMRQRLDFLEKLIGDSADKHARELAKARAQQAESSEAHTKLVTDCKEKVDSMHKALGESIQKHAQEIEKVQMAHAKLAGDVLTHGRSHAAMKTRLDVVAGEKDALATSHTSIGERVKALERKVDGMQAGSKQESPFALLGRTS